MYADVFASASTGVEGGDSADGGSVPSGRPFIAESTAAAPAAAPASDELIGTARLELSEVGGALTICWAPIQPQARSVLKVECVMLPQGAATEWQRALAAEGSSPGLFS